MKIQSLAVIAVIILLPMTLILTTYIQSQAKTLSLQTEYDNKLKNTTYDALKAFQLNTANSDTSDISNSKIRDVEAAAKSFFNSLATNFNMPGYNKEILGEFVPALVFTMYDGYYIYAPYDNQLDMYNSNKDITNPDIYVDESDTDRLRDESLGTTYYQGQDLTGLKSYVYYSCHYKRGPNLDVVITYSLDNYIVVKGIDEHGDPVDLHGYLLSDADNLGSLYRGTSISNSETIRENVYFSGDGVPTGFYQYNVRQINGVRYYHVPGPVRKPNGSLDYRPRVYSLLNGLWLQSNVEPVPGATLDESLVHVNDVIENTNARNYYKKAQELKSNLLNAGILDLQIRDIVGWSGTDPNNVLQKYFGTEGDIEIFGEINNSGAGVSNTSIEEPESNFNQHRLSVIKYAIEKNLSVAINNFNTYSTSSTKFQMPRLNEEDWNLIYNNICILSFMQGLNIGGRIYNGYSVVPNNNNKEAVTDDSIQIVARNNSSGEVEVYDPTFKGFINNNTNYEILYATTRSNLSRAATEDRSDGKVRYFFRFWDDSVWGEPDYTNLTNVGGDVSGTRYVPNNVAWSSYNSVVTAKDNNSDYTLNGTPHNNIFDYLDDTGNDKLKQVYYTALARDREGMFRVENDSFKTEHSDENE